GVEEPRLLLLVAASDGGGGGGGGAEDATPKASWPGEGDGGGPPNSSPGGAPNAFEGGTPKPPLPPSPCLEEAVGGPAGMGLLPTDIGGGVDRPGNTPPRVVGVADVAGGLVCISELVLLVPCSAPKPNVEPP
ncbi:unnamed protein product, partial [Ectocarpus sp. 8 AP-2014]